MTRPHRTASEDVAAIAEDAERTREELGRTVAALAAKTDVKGRAKTSVMAKAQTAKSGAHRVADKAGRHPGAVFATLAMLGGALVRALFKRRRPQPRGRMFGGRRRGAMPMSMRSRRRQARGARGMMARLMTGIMGRSTNKTMMGRMRAPMGKSMMGRMRAPMGKTMMGRTMGKARTPIGKTMMGGSMGRARTSIGKTMGKTMGSPVRYPGRMTR
ncbi:hypothetical protein GCM10009555_073730 [Acrocarpospora macrocephala]|uniref:DUF3618 domain-containing protein n=1 Tax=Acrocarpospora macrocephala TaxID=150177 RepID=A0A5M3X9Z5_9ACTN|nr:DUF3618 domain-containing protein [Acrocarpospora macrocephala]GES16321.1 hypothetical protein Amac_099190 [Acrocarpospora macrocephala]